VSGTVGFGAAAERYPYREPVLGGTLDAAGRRHYASNCFRATSRADDSHRKRRHLKFRGRLFCVSVGGADDFVDPEGRANPMTSGVLTPEQQRLVMESAMQLMSSRNLADITLEQLTRSCGVSAFDIVRHYQSKENILAAMLERELELIAGAVAAPELRFPSET